MITEQGMSIARLSQVGRYKLGQLMKQAGLMPVGSAGSCRRPVACVPCRLRQTCLPGSSRRIRLTYPCAWRYRRAGQLQDLTQTMNALAMIEMIRVFSALKPCSSYGVTAVR